MNYLQNSHQDSQPGMCFFSFLFSFPSLTLKTVAVAPSHTDSAAPFPHVQDALGPEPMCPALAGPVPRPPPLPPQHPWLRVGIPGPSRGVTGANEFGLGQPPLSLGCFCFFGAFQPRVLVASPASTTLTSSDIS